MRPQPFPRLLSWPLRYFLCIAVVLMWGTALAHLPSTLTGAGVLYDADFDAFDAGTPLPADATGSSDARPSSIDSNLTATVEDTTTLEGTSTVNTTKFVRLRESCGEAPTLHFDRGIALGTASSPNAIAHVALDVLFENLESYQILFRNGAGSGIPGPASQTVADIDTTSTGNMHFQSFGGTTTIAYQAGVTYHIDAFFDLGNNRWYVFVNGDRVVNGTAILDSPLGLVGIGFNFSSFCPPDETASFSGVLQFDNFALAEVGAIPGVETPATIANVLTGLGTPWAAAVRDGYAYVADTESHTVWKVNLSDATDKMPVAGIGWNPDIDSDDRAGYNGDGIEATQAQLNNPSGIAVDSAGNIYIADRGNHAIRKVAAGSSFITTVAGMPPSSDASPLSEGTCFASDSEPTKCKPATEQMLFGPMAMALDQDDHLYFIDEMNFQVKKLYTSGERAGLLAVVAGVGFPGKNDGPANGLVVCTEDDCTPGARFNSPAGLAVGVVDGETIVYIADDGNHRIRTVSSEGEVQTLQTGPLRNPMGVATGGGGTVYIADYGNHRVLRATGCSGEGCSMATVAGTGTAGSAGGIGDPATAIQFDGPVALALDGNLLYIVDTRNGRIVAGDFTPPVILLK